MSDGVFKVSVDFDTSKVLGQLEMLTQKAQMRLDARVLQDSNFFIPKDTSMLEKSGVDSTVIGKGRIIWNSPYAHIQYYGINFDHSKQRNPNATAKWFETAKARFIKEWEKIVNDAYCTIH